jgi:hypothetical protein
MIRYRVTRAKLEQLIEQHTAGWLDRATARTDHFREISAYDEASTIWSEVKPVYMTLQGESKCAYCERKLESVELGKSEEDVEHFRPKGNVSAWAVPGELAGKGVVCTDIPDDGAGYFLLPYHIFNYAASCKPCNSALKGDRFPIAGEYVLDGEDPADLRDEKPYLIYPIGTVDEDPERLIEFRGISPRAVPSLTGHRRLRALVTIEFFKLDDVLGRKNLVRERAVIITALYPQLERAVNASTEDRRQKARDLVAGFTSAMAPHANCARSLKRLFEEDPAEAEAVFEKAAELITSIS